MPKRKLTEDEKDFAVSGISIEGGAQLPTRTSVAAEAMLRKMARDQLEHVELYPELLPELREEIAHEQQRSMVEPGEGVGVICAHSLGHATTQANLDSFHKSGLVSSTVITGVPRLIELINSTKSPKCVSCKVRFTQKFETIDALRRFVGHSLHHKTFGQLVTAHEFFSTTPERGWFSAFCAVYGEPNIQSVGVRCELNKEWLYRLHLHPAKIAAAILAETGLSTMWSPTNENEFFVFLSDVVADDVFDSTLAPVGVCGVCDIEDVLFRKDDDGWFIETIGSNLRGIFGLPGVDTERSMSNHPWEILDIFGIETTREFLTEEILGVVSDTCFVNKQHVQLLVDVMLKTGTILSISRYGMRKGDGGVLQSCTFEESTENFVRAATYAEEDPVNGVSASIMMGRMPKIGTGTVELKMNLDALAR